MTTMQPPSLAPVSAAGTDGVITFDRVRGVVGIDRSVRRERRRMLARALLTGRLRARAAHWTVPLEQVLALETRGRNLAVLVTTQPPEQVGAKALTTETITWAHSVQFTADQGPAFERLQHEISVALWRLRQGSGGLRG